MDIYSFIALLQEVLAPFDFLLRFLSQYGYSYCLLLIAGLIFWAGFTRVGGRLALGILISTITFAFCRQFFASPRPYWSHPDLFNGMPEKGYGMPSGHTQTATTFWGLFAFSLQQHSPSKKGWFVAALLILLTGLSRLYLGVHYPLQIVAGLIMGLCLLLGFIALEQPVIRLLTPLPAHQKVIITVLACLAPLITILLLREGFAIGSGNGADFPYYHLMRFSGLFAGTAVGLLFVSKTRLSPSFTLFFTRAIPGAISVIVLWKFMPAFSDLKESPAFYYLARYCAFFLLALWGTLLWPLLHKRLCSRYNSL